MFRNALIFRRRYSGTMRVVAIFGVILTLFTAADKHIRPMIKTMAASQAKVFATRAINKAVNEQLASGEIPYDSLVKVSLDNNGKVTSVQTDMVKLNLLKSAMTNAASEQLNLLQSQTVRIPIGTLLGLQILSGRGPRVEFKIVPAGFVNSQLTHRFDTAGINQTRHQIVLELIANISAVLPGYSAASQVTSSLILAETVIVGVSPEAFTQVITEQTEPENIIADYGS